MVFWESSECDKLVYQSVVAVGTLVEKFLNKALAESSLSQIDAKIRYIPIVMPPEVQGHYPARSSIKKSKNIIDCAPQLNYQVFLSKNWKGMIESYLGGLDFCIEAILKIGGTPAQAKQFEEILEDALIALKGRAPDYLG